MTVSIGVLLPSRESAMYPPYRGDPRLLVDLAVRCEELGFDSVWIGDSLLAKPRAEPLSLLAAVAAVTDRVELGTAVLLASMRRAEQLAQQAATVDALADGRLVLGVGAGPAGSAVAADFEYSGSDHRRRGTALMEVVARARELWCGEGVDERTGRLQPVPVSVGGPRVWLGGTGPRTFQRAAQQFDGWFPIPTDLATYTAGLAEVRAATVAAGRRVEDVTAAAYLTVNIGDPESAQRELTEHLETYYGAPAEVLAGMMGSFAGPQEAVADYIKGFVDAGCTDLCIRLASPAVTTQVDRLAELLAELRA